MNNDEWSKRAGEKNERDDSDDDPEDVIMSAIPSAEKFRETERARLFRGFAEFFMNHAEGDEVAKEESTHQPGRREPVTVNVSDQPDEHVAAVFRGGSPERGEKRRDCPSGGKVIVFLICLLAEIVGFLFFLILSSLSSVCGIGPKAASRGFS